MEQWERSWQQICAMKKEDYNLIDIRDELSFSYGNIPGSINITEEMLLADAEKWREKTVVLCCKKGESSLALATRLREAGWDAYSLQGGYLAWLMQKMQEEEQAPEITTFDIEQSLRKKFKKSIWSKFTKAVRDYELVQEGDRIAVCISGGKDSMLMAKLFQELQRHHKVEFELVFLVMDPGYSAANRQIIENNAKKLGIPITIFESDIFDAVFEIEKSPCYLCARMRRGHLYHQAKQLGCNKIALGHHYDDVIETILMGMLYGAQMQTMMPKLHSTNFEEWN